MLQRLLQQRVQKGLLAFKMAVYRGLADANGVCDLRHRSGLKALGGKQLQRGLQDLLPGIAFFHAAFRLLPARFSFIVASER